MKNREIKFKAWDKKNEILIPVDQILHIEFKNDGIAWVGGWVVVPDSQGDPEQGLHQIEKDNLELLQYTGLKDKNGKEIYEGDIVRGYFREGLIGTPDYWHDKESNFVVEYQIDGYFPFINFKQDYEDLEYFKTDKCEVIGNVFENPELLKEVV